MALQSRLDTLVRSYHDDLASIAQRTVESLDEGPDHAARMLRKLVMEAVRLDVYEESTLLPLLRKASPDGEAQARAALAEATEGRAALEALTRRGIGESGFRDALRLVLEGLSERARRQDTRLRELAAAVPEEGLEQAAAEFTPTQEAGSTHSLPPGLAMEGEWPAPGWVEECRRAFTEERATRGVLP